MIVTLGLAEVERFRNLVTELLGLKPDESRLDQLAEVLGDRLQASGCRQAESYLWELRHGAGQREELRALAAALTIGETCFFRYPQSFRAFAEVALPERLAARRAGEPLRILSAGCASGEEPFSLAIALRQEATRLPALAGRPAEILGIDVNPAALERARRARYSAWSLRETPAEIRDRYFRAEGQTFILDDAVCGAVGFEERNLMHDDRVLWQSGRFEIIFCRNVLMYFSSAAMRAVVARLAAALAPGGFLFLGHAETLRGISTDFHLLHTHDTFYYQRRDAGARLAAAERDLLAWVLPAGSEQTDDSSGAGLATAATGLLAPVTPVEHQGGLMLPAGASQHPPALALSWMGEIEDAARRIAALARDTAGASSAAAPEPAPAPASQALPQAGPAPGSHAPPQATAAAAARAAELAPVLELFRQERFAEALQMLRAMPAAALADQDTQMLHASILTNAGAAAEAEEVCRQLLAVDEFHASAHYLMALCREHAGDLAAAIRHDETAAYLDSGFAMPHLHLGLLARRQRRLEAARRELRAALDLLASEDGSRILLLGGGFHREALRQLCRSELSAVETER